MSDRLKDLSSDKLSINDKVLISSLGSWLLAFRPKTLTASLVPVFVATALAKNVGSISWLTSFYALVVSIFIQIGTNLVNDAVDFKKGADTSRRVGPIRATQAGLLTAKQVMSGGLICFGLALFFGIPLMIQGGWPIAVILSVSVACGYLYTGGPRSLAYSGLGDVFVLAFFGWVATMGVYFLQTGTLSILSFLAGTQVGLFCTAIIAMNNVRDVEGDTLAYKLTLPVRYGLHFGRLEVTTLIILGYFIGCGWFFAGYYLAGFLPLMTIPLAWKIIGGIWGTLPGKAFQKYFEMTALLHALFGVLLALGLIFS